MDTRFELTFKGIKIAVDDKNICVNFKDVFETKIALKDVKLIITKAMKSLPPETNKD